MAKKKIALLIVALLAVDQIVKIWIKTHFALDESVTVFPNWFFIRFIENPGAAFGFELGGSYGKLILSIFRLVAIGALGYYIHHLLRKKAPTGVLVGFSLIFAGALGNVIDSAFYGLLFSESTFTAPATFLPEGGGYAGFLHGKVVDMLFFPLFRGTYPSWIPGIGGESFLFFSPIFNLADSYITLGVLYMLLFQRKFFTERRAVVRIERLFAPPSPFPSQCGRFLPVPTVRSSLLWPVRRGKNVK